MDNTTSIGKEALRYRLTVNESLGVIITLAVTALVAIVLYLIHFGHAALIAIAVFIVIFLVQGIILYFFSLMQYKNLKYSIGQNALTFQNGTFAIERETIPFEKVKNSTFDQSFIQRLFAVGDITIEQDEEKFIWENIDSASATLISNAVSAKGDVQPITVSTANAVADSVQSTTGK